MVYSTSRCPSCGQVIRRQTNPVKEIGIPFERCRHCGATYINSYKEEWITKSPFKRFFFFIQAGVLARAFLIPALILSIPMAAWDMSAEALRVLWPIMSAAWIICGYFVHKKSENDDIIKSLERTKDTEYLNLLRKAGYKIYPINTTNSFTEKVPNSSTNRTAQNNVSQHGNSSCDNKPTHICLSDANDSPKRIPGGIYSEDISIQPQTSTPPPKSTFPTQVIADGLAELCIKELVEVMGICDKHHVTYDERKLIISTFCYFYVIWIFNFENITAGQARDVEKIYKNHFCNFNRKNFEDLPLKTVLENEEIFSEQLKRIDRRIRASYHANNHTFIDDGLTDEYILEFINFIDDKEKIKPEIVHKVLKEWASVANKAGEQTSVSN